MKTLKNIFTLNTLLKVWISSLITFFIMGLFTIVYEFAVNGITANFGIY